MYADIWLKMKVHKIRNCFLLYIFFCSFFLLSRPLTIFFILGRFPAPSQTFILNQMTRLIEDGHNVLIYAFHYDTYDYVHPDIIKYGLLDRCIYTMHPGDLPECDIVLCQFGYLGKKIVESPHLQKWLRGKKVVTCLRGADITSRVKKNPHMYDVLFKRGHLFLPVCEFLKQRLIKLGCKEHLISVHYSAIDCSKFAFKKRNFPRSNAIRFISVSRLVEKKGLDYAIKAMSKIIRKYPKVRFMIVGEGPERRRLEKLIKHLHLEKNIKLCGWKTQEEVAQLLNNAHIFVLPSITATDGNEEGIPNALKEAMAMGLPVIATFHAGNTELIEDNVSGYLVPQKNIVALYNKMIYVIEHPEEWASIGINARQTIENRFEINKNIKQLEAIFYQLLNNNKN